MGFVWGVFRLSAEGFNTGVGSGITPNVGADPVRAKAQRAGNQGAQVLVRART